MMVFVMYDISDTPTRTSFIKRLQYYGLHRVQKSVFSGYLDIEDRLDLASEFDLFLSSEGDSIMLVPTCENCLGSILSEGELNLPQKANYRFV